MNRNNRLSDSDDDALDEAANEHELQRLQRQFRRLCGDHRAYSEQSQNVIRKQKALIQALDGENTEICTNLENTDSVQKCNGDKQVTHKLQELVGLNDDYDNEIKKEKEGLENLDEQIRGCEREIKKQHKRMGGTHHSHAQVTHTQKKIRVLENRLDKAMVNFNKQLTRNRELREDIDHLRQERRVFDNLYKKLSKELDECKQDIGEITEQATQAYEQRDEYQNKMVQLQERNTKDQAQHDVEMRDLERIISHDNKLKEFMSSKAMDRCDFKAEEAAKKRRGVGSDRSADAERRLVENYEEAFNRIKEITKEEDLEIIVENFIKKEDDNFALFNYVNELSNETELIFEQNESLKAEMENYQAETVAIDGGRKEKMADLEAKFNKINSSSEADQDKLVRVKKVLDQLKDSIGIMFDKVECDSRPIDDMLGNGIGIQETNIMIYLGLIEQKTNELLAVQHYQKMKEYKQSETNEPPPIAETLGLPPKRPQIQQIEIIPPSAIDGQDDISSDDDDDRPFTREEIRSKVVKTVDRLDPFMYKAPAAPNKAAKDGKKKK